jgi:peptidoglycan/LPS O-acetylase OafA/YrhL
VLPVFLARRLDRVRLTPLGSERLDMLRGLAALTVLVGHVRAFLFVPFGESEHRNAIDRLAYFTTGLGHQAVIVFFLLSGYLIGWHVLDAFNKGHWSWRWYAARRLSRLYVVLLPALLIGAGIDRLGLHLFGHSGVYAGAARYRFITPFDTLHNSSLPAFFGNAGYVQQIKVPTFGSNGPLWSLSYEFWYYAAFPLLVLVLVRGLARSFASALLAAGGLASVAVFVGDRIALYFLLWLAGAAIVLAPPVPRLARRGPARTAALLVALGGCAAALAASRPLSERPGDFAVGAAFAMLIYLLVQPAGEAARDGRTCTARLWAWLAGLSFTLYVVHFPLLAFLRAGLDHEGVAVWQPTPLRVLAAVGVALAVVAYAFVLSLGTERQTTRVRKAAERLLRRAFGLGSVRFEA